MLFAKFLRTPILQNIWERLLLFISPQNNITNSGGEFGLDETSTKCHVSIFLNVTILFNHGVIYFHDLIKCSHIIYMQVKKSFFNISINILIKVLTLHAF